MIVDIFFAVFILLAIIQGARKGFVHSVISFIAFLAAIIAGLKYTDEFTVVLRDWFDSSSAWLPFFAFILIFMGVMMIVGIVGAIIDRTVKLLMLGFLNRIGGVIFQSLITVLIFSIMLWFVNQVNLISPETKAESKIYFYIEPFAPLAFNFMSNLFPFMEGMFDNIENSFEDMGRRSESITAFAG